MVTLIEDVNKGLQTTVGANYKTNINQVHKIKTKRPINKNDLIKPNECNIPTHFPNIPRRACQAVQECKSTQLTKSHRPIAHHETNPAVGIMFDPFRGWSRGQRRAGPDRPSSPRRRQASPGSRQCSACTSG